MELLVSMNGEGMGISSLQVMITLVLDTFIKFKAGPNNLLGINTKSLQLDQGDV